MRIRKNAKRPPLFYATSSLKPGTVVQTHVCQLNQSPWDVMSFSPPSTPPPPPLPPPSPSQVNGNDVCVGNGSSVDTIPVLQREFDGGWKWEHSGGRTTADKAEQPVPVRDEQPVVLCCKTDGRSWQCRRPAAKGNSLCEHHLSLMRNYSSSHSKRSEREKTALESQRRHRPKKTSASALSSNPYEFYYYSGFGPRWGKKRGEVRKNVAPDDNVPKDVEHEVELNPSILSQFNEEDEDAVEEEEDEEKGESRRKRARKPIKARSLKSLM